MSMKFPGREQRGEVRTAAGGEVRLTVDGFADVIVGRLVDESPSGFRAAHQEPRLTHDLEVEFRYGTKSGRARVMWSRMAEGAWESGLLVLRGGPQR